MIHKLRAGQRRQGVPNYSVVACCVVVLRGSLASRHRAQPGSMKNAETDSTIPMAALRIFISHSARPRASEAADAQAQANWRLLQDTREVLAAQHGDAIEILVDDQDLQPSDCWEQCLDEWLYDCHAAIVLLSRRAVGESNWVRKEATILSWRAAVEPEFALFPVLLDGLTPADLEQDDYFRMLGISRWQFVQAAACAQDILAGVKPRLDALVALKRTSLTPFGRLVTAVEMVLAKEVDEDTLRALWINNHLSDTPPRFTGPDRARCFARGLALYLFSEGEKALERFRDILDALMPRPPRERAEEMFKYIRALWVDIGAAGVIANAKSHGKCLAMNGKLVGMRDEKLKVDRFALDRYLERAWPATDQIDVIQLAFAMDEAEIWQKVRAGFWTGDGIPPEDFIEDRLRNRKEPVIVLLPTLSGLTPDPLLLLALERRAKKCKSLIFVVDIGEQRPGSLPSDLSPVLPDLSEDAKWERYLKTEWTQYADELDAVGLINNKYGSKP